MNLVSGPSNVFLVLDRLEKALPDLVGDEGWEAIREEIKRLQERLAHCTDPRECLRLAAELVEIISPHGVARERFHKELLILKSVHEVIKEALAALETRVTFQKGVIQTSACAATAALGWEVDLVENGEKAKSGTETRWVIGSAGGLGGGKSIKFRNLWLDSGKMLEMSAGVFMTGQGMLEKPQPLLVAAGVLILLRSLTKALTVDLTEQEASVFWGIVQAQDKDHTAEEPLIAQYANEERQKVGLEPLTERQITKSLHVLKSLKCVDSVAGQPGNWRIIERYRIRS